MSPSFFQFLKENFLRLFNTTMLANFEDWGKLNGTGAEWTKHLIYCIFFYFDQKEYK